MKKETFVNIKIPVQPEVFICEEANLIMTLQNIKDFARDYGFTYTLDYINEKVLFTDKPNDNNNQL